MKRPLAIFGGTYLLVMLAATRLPVPLQVVLGTGGIVGFAVSLRWLKTPGRGLVPLASAAVGLALLVHMGYDALILAPRMGLAGSTHRATARVLETEPGYGGDTVHASLQVLALDDDTLPTGFRVQVRGLPNAEVGQVLLLDLEFYAFTGATSRTYNLAKGYAVGATAVGAPVPQGVSHTFLTRMRQLQYAASQNLRNRLPLRLSSVGAAMTLGDRRFVSSEVADAYRSAGLSHMLVVSGLHLSVLCGTLHRFLRRFMRRRGAAIVGLGFTALFMAFTGFTPSIVRSGLAWLLVFAAELSYRKSDTLTSLGAAALLLATQNPYAAADVGLLLSFSATLGALGTGGVQQALRRRLPHKPHQRPTLLRRFGQWAAGAALSSLLVTLATLPVLVFSGLGLSLFSLPANLLALPMMTPLVLCGFVAAIPAGLPVLGLLGAPAALVQGFLLVLLERITGFCNQFPGAWLPLGGAFGLCVVAVFYLLALAAFKTRRVLACTLVGALLLPLVLVLHAGLSANTVRVWVAGRGNNSSLVVTRGDEAVILYRSRQSANAIKTILRQSRAPNCVLLVDLRRTAESTEYETLFAPQQVVAPQGELVAGAVFQPLQDVEISVARQADGNVACADVAGFKIGLYAGSVNLALYAPLDVLVAGAGSAQGQYQTLITGTSPPEWAHADAQLLYNDGGALLWLRPGKSIRYREVYDGVDS